MFVPAVAGGVPTFHGLPHISDTAVADVLQISRARILGDSGFKRHFPPDIFRR